MSKEYPNASIPKLTKTEMRVMENIAKGLTSQQVADALALSKRTVDFHLGNIYSKFDVSNRVQATNKARALGLIE
jgi:DNA-binding CsgD family transcriptional regulator